DIGANFSFHYCSFAARVQAAAYGVAHKNKIGDESRDRGIKQDPRLDHKYWSALRGRGVESACVRRDVGNWHLADIGLCVANVCF
ncbi:MAG: hypothetical protein WA683_16085, partial [Pseudolabrys sp.]